jgi:ADP-heptose:LPS heptosyltransferase
VHGGNKADDKGWLKKAPSIDCQAAIGSLPRHFRGSREDFPRHNGYLFADPTRTAAWRRRLGAGGGELRVGIAWRGGSLRTRQFTRSIPIEQWLPILQRPQVRFFSLQYGDNAGELAQLRRMHNIEISDFGGETADLDELAAAICALDLVISVDNTVVHLAGALGKSVWVLLGCCPEWRYLRQGEEMPWYPSARLFRQHSPRDWSRAVDQVVHALQQMSVSRHG